MVMPAATTTVMAWSPMNTASADGDDATGDDDVCFDYAKDS